MRPVLAFSPGKKLIIHKVFKERSCFSRSNSGSSFGQFCLSDGLGTQSSGLVSKTCGFLTAFAVKPKVVPVNVAPSENAHFHLLSFGSETETLQPARYC